ncbi:MAG: hypothetical protein QM758_20570 [Armatimonas sp.]
MPASQEGYQLGLRLRMFEAAWAKATPAQKKRALPAVRRATSLLAIGVPAVGSAAALDSARGMLRTKPWTDAEALVGTLTVEAPRCLMPGSKGLELTVEALYGDREFPKGVVMEATLDALEAGIAVTGRADVRTLPVKLTLAVPTPKIDFDATLTIRFLLNDMPVLVEERTLSLLTSGPVRFIKAPNPLASEAFRLYTAIATGEQPETEVPAAALLKQTLAADSAKPLWGQGQPGEFWLTFNGTPTRLLAPEAVEKRRPLPLVIALHDLNGSENSFFDGYHNGKIKALCEKRGWLLLSIRSGPGFRDLQGILKTLATLYPIDRKKVFLAGHGMGAVFACTLVESNPMGTFAALACLGGGGKLTRKLPTFVALGEQDTGAYQTKQMPVKSRIYPNTEHLTVVQDALSDVFSFFDKYR